MKVAISGHLTPEGIEMVVCHWLTIGYGHFPLPLSTAFSAPSAKT
jgi:hypothetical protein